MTKNIYKDFDLPNKHLTNEADFIPPRTRDEEEEARRRANPSGTVILEFQDKGLEIARAVLGGLKNSSEEDIKFASETFAATGLNTAWYSFARNARVQRRRLKLEVLATDDPEQRPSTFMLLNNAISDLEDAEAQSKLLVAQYIIGSPESFRQRTILGRTVGHAALTLSCVPLGDRIGYDDYQMTDFDLQDLARRRGLYSLEDGRRLASKIGSAPSLAQLAYPDSDLSVYWRRHAPNGALEAYEEAIAS